MVFNCKTWTAVSACDIYFSALIAGAIPIRGWSFILTLTRLKKKLLLGCWIWLNYFIFLSLHRIYIHTRLGSHLALGPHVLLACSNKNAIGRWARKLLRLNFRTQDLINCRALEMVKTLVRFLSSKIFT